MANFSAFQKVPDIEKITEEFVDSELPFRPVLGIPPLYYTVCISRGHWLLVGYTIDVHTLQVLAIVFVATLIRSAFGFGEALVAVPLLAFCIPLTQAAPLAVLLSITIAAVVVAQDWDKIHWRSAGWLVFFTLLGIPLGLLLLTSSHQQMVKATLAIIIILFTVYSLAGRRPLRFEHDSRAWLATCGFAAGVLGGAYGMNGPPLVIYGSMRRWQPQQFRATLQAYFLPASMLGMAGYVATGLWIPDVTRYYLLSLPVMLPAVLLGRWTNHRLHSHVFLRYIYLGLAAIGVLVLVQTSRGATEPIHRTRSTDYLSRLRASCAAFRTFVDSSGRRTILSKTGSA